MKKYYYGLDVLRGIGIFTVILLHTAFYFYKDLYDVDLNNPSLIITIIGFLLMFAGLFAMISGTVYTIQFMQSSLPVNRLKMMIISGLFLLFIAYFYFLFTGPGIIDFTNRAMDESLLVGFINQGYFSGLSKERILYVDSLVMLGTNIVLMAVLFKIIGNRFLKEKSATTILIIAVIFLIISYIRIPLYQVYINAWDNNQTMLVLLLNWFVAKNNPIFPFFAFALIGIWFAKLLKEDDFSYLFKRVISVAILFIIIGITGYILAPETMLERAIDPTWYFIIVTQIGLFLLLMLLFVRLFDFHKSNKKRKCDFLARFGIAGLTIFVFESVIAAGVFFLINQLIVFELGIPGALIFGLAMAMAYGLLLILWERAQYRYGIEWLTTRVLSLVGTSTKIEKLRGYRD